MKQVLKIDTSINGAKSLSSELAEHFIETVQAQHEQLGVQRIDLHTNPLPHLDRQAFLAFSSTQDKLNSEQAEALARSDNAIRELRQADYIVLSAPMYNFGVPSTLKSWMDHIARAGVTFEYTAEGPKGLLGDKTVWVITTRGGQYKDSGHDYQIPFIKQFFQFIGISDIHVIYAEGLAQSDVREQSIQQAKLTVNEHASAA